MKCYNVVDDIRVLCESVASRVSPRSSINLYEARALCTGPEHSGARRSGSFIRAHAAHARRYISIHGNRRPGRHCVRKSNLFHIYTRPKPPSSPRPAGPVMALDRGLRRMVNENPRCQ